ncbi:MerR family transcriptional regulator [Streptococcus sp. X16XC17]|uniref:MerR family transcriptional regulator n=1 Tax=unclassified Streptococcus TaxID=2608887 RepID=UPI00066FE8F6|nr:MULTISPECIES: MerR family transcriptional regulator [unclassified Streptococcus]TCD45963.1 MerR family transcriptional regulator [Streptococcus sp. X16XC17]
MKTVKEISQMSGVSVRTLHHYHKIGLLVPANMSPAGYRLYDDRNVARLQQILLYRELEFPLKDIKNILDAEDFDSYAALDQQIVFLEEKIRHLEGVINHAKALQRGGNNMNFTAYDKSQLDDLQAEAKERWGDTTAYINYEQKASYSVIQQEMQAIFSGFGEMKNREISDSRVQKQVKSLQDYITEHFYLCTDEILAGLGSLYVEDESFKQNIDQAGGLGTASFVSSAIAHCCQ